MAKKMLDHLRDFPWFGVDLDLMRFLWQTSKNPAMAISSQARLPRHCHRHRFRYHRHVEKNRIEAFSDGVLAIIITIMVLDLHVPRPTDQMLHPEKLAALKPLLPVFLTYILSFIYLGIYWNNHHHLLKAAHRVTGGMMWANLHLLFWLSLFPFVTGWMGENHFTLAPTAIYGAVLLAASIAYYILQGIIFLQHGERSKLAKSIGSDLKGKLSPVFYAIGIATAFIRPWISCAIYAGVALMWLIPDRRIERVVEE